MFGIKAKNKIKVNWFASIDTWTYDSDFYDIAYEDVSNKPYLSQK